MDDDVQLVRLAKAGNRKAFSTLVRRYQNMVFRTALAIVRNPEEAADVAQESFVRAFLSLRALKDDGAFPGWLARIATRQALDAVKNRIREGEQIRSAAEQGEGGAPGNAFAQDPEGRTVLLDALAQLSPEHRAVLVLHEVHGFQYQEIADIVGIPVGTVRSRLHHARLQLRRLFINDSPEEEWSCNAGKSRNASPPISTESSQRKRRRP
ncbi:RNA polymerase subunit sigma-24 [Kyrpidia spormannii]|uniref:RNA polymerase subunit sigma-24 n=1 Tax=Kyrpidia spormannii TaxID=2055160 RepID=A0A2K8N467_9BACL|nr:sigma-70 family RNA polymerase sigma factor [Kyrpidia spormannii]ATY84251.1 RNA polymerase subunit sigma-24 [Kyrpidia spormannii]